jgi:hypothetical protein
MNFSIVWAEFYNNLMNDQKNGLYYHCFPIQKKIRFFFRSTTTHAPLIKFTGHIKEWGWGHQRVWVPLCRSSEEVPSILLVRHYYSLMTSIHFILFPLFRRTPLYDDHNLKTIIEWNIHYHGVTPFIYLVICLI